MAMAFLFRPVSMTRAQYEEGIRQLAAAGQGSPAGRLYHCCFGAEPELKVFDIWESREAIEAFAETMRPIMLAVGVDPGQPEVSPVLNAIAG